MYADCTKIMLVKPVWFFTQKKNLLSWFCDCTQEVLINYANCAVKMAVAPCLNIKYRFKRIVVYCIIYHNTVLFWKMWGFILGCNFICFKVRVSRFKVKNYLIISSSNYHINCFLPQTILRKNFRFRGV